MKKVICQFTAVLLAFSSPLIAGGPLLVADSLTMTPQGPVQLSLLAESCAITDNQVRFQGFLMDARMHKYPQPLIVEVPRSVASLHRIAREGDHWSLDVNELKLSGRMQSSAAVAHFVGQSLDNRLAVSITDDITGLEVVAVIASAAVIICGAGYLYDAFTRQDCIAAAERACGKGNFALDPPTFGLRVKSETSLAIDIGCGAACTFKCYGPLPKDNQQ